MDINLSSVNQQHLLSVKFNRGHQFFQQGFTLLNLAVTLSILSIVLAGGTPKLFGLVTSNRVAAQISQLHSTINYAKTESVTRNRVVLVCPTKDNISCLKNKNWSHGWIVFVDRNNDRELSEKDDILRIFQPASNITIRYSAFGPRKYIPFYPTDGMRTNGSFLFCAQGYPKLNRALIVSKARPRVSKTTTGGEPVNCTT